MDGKYFFYGHKTKQYDMLERSLEEEIFQIILKKCHIPKKDQRGHIFSKQKTYFGILHTYIFFSQIIALPLCTTPYVINYLAIYIFPSLKTGLSPSAS